MYQEPLAQQPGLHPQRVLRLMRRSIDECGIDLDGATVLTEAATGAYVVTPVIAALAGAKRVLAMTKDTRHGSVDEVMRQTRALAEAAGVYDQIDVITELTAEVLAAADIVTNSGHLRPLDEQTVGWMRPDAVVPLMFESWELGLGREDIDIDRLGELGIRFAGTNERHPAVDVFSYLGLMAVKLLTDAGVGVRGTRILLLCENPFKDYIERGLASAGAAVHTVERLTPDSLDGVDAIVVAMRPTGFAVVSTQDLHLIADHAPGAVLAQFWGDVPRADCQALGVPCVPLQAPPSGHMGVLPSALGPEPIVRLQAGGLKVASVLRKPHEAWTHEEARFVDEY